MSILVFKTNLSDTACIEVVKPSLDVHPGIVQWNVDLHDCDKVLRIVTEHMLPREIEILLEKAGFLCEELV
ncbi:MAG: hypothetical protein U0X40_01430 [Ferruginibacter sp.]